MKERIPFLVWGLRLETLQQCGKKCQSANLPNFPPIKSRIRPSKGHVKLKQWHHIALLFLHLRSSSIAFLDAKTLYLEIHLFASVFFKMVC